MIDGNRTRCIVLNAQHEMELTNMIEDFCKGKKIVNIQYFPVSDVFARHRVFITYLVDLNEN